jgi:crotonobetainyl-CoA:carnitine CoA-transferase CaiB-like acyl-CoA transferase
MQGGAVAALAALTALWARQQQGGQYVDVSVQDAAVAVGAFAVQRLGDGAYEHRKGRSFKYGGVVPCSDGFIELLTLEDRQWAALMELLGHPDWAADESLRDPIGRSRKGAEINAHLREWAATRRADDVVREAQMLGIPVAQYRRPAEIVTGEHERSRGLFAPAQIPGVGTLDMVVSPYLFDGRPLRSPRTVPDALRDTVDRKQPVRTR